MKNFKVEKFSAGHKAFLVIVLIFFIFISPFTVAKAHAWMAIPAALIKQLLETIMSYIEQIIVAVLKTVGATTVSQLSAKLVTGGNSGKSMVITDWTKYLQKGPADKTATAVNAYIDQAFRGKGSSSGYRPAPNTVATSPTVYNPGVGTYNNYSAILSENLKSQTVASSQPKITYEGSPLTAYDGPNMKSASEMNEGVNSGLGMAVNTWSEQNLTYDFEVEKAKIEATSSGFTGLKDDSGKTIAPAGVVGNMLSGSMDLGNKMLAQANSIPTVLAALATKLVQETFTKGLGNLSAKVGKEITGVKSQSGAQVKAQINTQGPGTMYKKY